MFFKRKRVRFIMVAREIKGNESRDISTTIIFVTCFCKSDFICIWSIICEL